MAKGLKAEDPAVATERGRSPSGVATADEADDGRGRAGFDPAQVRRWSVQRKREVVLRLLRDEPVAGLASDDGAGGEQRDVQRGERGFADLCGDHGEREGCGAGGGAIGAGG